MRYDLWDMLWWGKGGKPEDVLREAPHATIEAMTDTVLLWLSQLTRTLGVGHLCRLPSSTRFGLQDFAAHVFVCPGLVPRFGRTKQVSWVSKSWVCDFPELYVLFGTVVFTRRWHILMCLNKNSSHVYAEEIEGNDGPNLLPAPPSRRPRTVLLLLLVHSIRIVIIIILVIMI